MAAVPVEVIPEEGLFGTNKYHHLARFYPKRTYPELHLRFVHRVKLRVKSMQKTFVYDLNIYISIARHRKKKKNTVVHGVNFPRPD